MIAACIDDYRILARQRLPRFLFDYVDGGSYAEETMRANVADLRTLRLRQRVMRDVDQISLAAPIFGQPSALPVGLAPIGLAGLYARRGEVQAARAARAAGLPFILSSSSACGIEEVVAGAGAPVPLQLYMIRDRHFMADLLARALALGVETLVLTVDLIVHSPRHRDVRTGLTGPQDLRAQAMRAWQIVTHPRWAWDVGVRGRPHVLGNFAPVMPEGAGLAHFTAWVARNFDPRVTWADMEWLRSQWPHRIAIKGVLDPADAAEACAIGASDIVVSNHGGRQLDGASSAIGALPAIVDTVAGRAEVLMDGGIRSGIDVLRAMALGARGVLIGRPWAYALAADGEAGVARMLGQLRHEIAVAMALTGQTDITKLDRSMLME